jgi:PAS domain S-box-containing protein
MPAAIVTGKALTGKPEPGHALRRRKMAESHEDIVSELAEHFRPILDNTPDGVYLWLDEDHKICNDRLAKLFGYTVQEWSDQEPFLSSFVAEEDRQLYLWNYQNRVADLAFPVTFRFRGRRSDGSTFAAETDMIPIAYKGHVIAYHFVRQVGE